MHQQLYCIYWCVWCFLFCPDSEVRKAVNHKRHRLNHRCTKKNCNRGTTLERSVGKLLSMCVCVRGGGGLLKLVLLARNFALNSDAVLNYKYMFGLHRGPLPTSQFNTYDPKRCDETRAQWRSQENHKQDQFLAVTLRVNIKIKHRNRKKNNLIKSYQSQVRVFI